MTKIFSIAVIVFHLLAPFSYAAAVSTYPEVIPGPGLPSLASLGLTSIELYQKKPDFADANTLDKRFDNYCGGGRYDSGYVDDVIACFNYLAILGRHLCSIPPDQDQHLVCFAGTTRISVLDNTDHETHSWYYDVALGVQWVFTYCNNNGQVEGDATANNNPDMIVIVGGPM